MSRRDEKFEEKKHQNDDIKGSYVETQKVERKKADFWRTLTIYFIILAVAWIVYANITNITESRILNVLREDNFSLYKATLVWLQILKSFSISGMFLFIAGYSARQSNLHRKNETAARTFTQKIDAIDFIIKSFPEADQNALSQKIVGHLFTESSSNDTAKGTLFKRNLSYK